jgi:hypothetical protein
MLTDKQRADGWIEHDGGECPVALDSRPLVLFRDGMGIVDQEDAPMAREWIFESVPCLWVHKPGPADIIAYRPEPKP